MNSGFALVKMLIFFLIFFFYFLSALGENDISFFTGFLVFQEVWQVVPAQGWHTHLGMTQGSFHSLESPSAAIIGVPETLCPMEGPVTPWAVALGINLSLHFISWTWSGTSL